MPAGKCSPDSLGLILCDLICFFLDCVESLFLVFFLFIGQIVENDRKLLWRKEGEGESAPAEGQSQTCISHMSTMIQHVRCTYASHYTMGESKNQYWALLWNIFVKKGLGVVAGQIQTCFSHMSTMNQHVKCMYCMLAPLHYCAD